MTYDTVATISQVTSLLIFIGMFVAVRGLRLLAQERPALRGGAAARARSRPTSPADGTQDGGADEQARDRRRSPASRPPATNGTASRSSTSRCPDGGCGPSTPPSSGPSATGSPIPPGRRSPATPRACSATASARWWPSEVERGQGARRPQYRDKLAAHAARPDQDATPTCCASPWPAARPPSRPTARPATAAARRASPAIPTSTTTTGCGAAASTTSTRPSASASAPTRRTRAPRRCRATALDKLLDDAQINDVAEYVLSLSGRAGDQAAAARGQTVFAEQCAACHGAGRQGQARAGRAQPHRRHLALRRQPAGDRREHPDRPRRRDAGLGRPARSRHPQGAGRLRPQPRRRAVGLACHSRLRGRARAARRRRGTPHPSLRSGLGWNPLHGACAVAWYRTVAGTPGMLARDQGAGMAKAAALRRLMRARCTDGRSKHPMSQASSSSQQHRGRSRRRAPRREAINRQQDRSLYAGRAEGLSQARAWPLPRASSGW